MLKRLSGILLSSLLLLCTWTTIAQNNNTSSPYSRFGLGDLHPYSYGRFAAMGGASIGSRHNLQINISNPASYASIDSMSFVFEFGVDGRFSDYKSATSQYTTNDVNFRYFALNWPVTHWLGMAMGVTPFADKGYEITFQNETDEYGNARHSFIGDGTLSKAFFGVGVDVTESLSLGFNLYYLFGTLNQADEVIFDRADIYNYSKVESSRLRDFAYNLGVQYDIPLKNDKYLTLGGTLESKPEFTAFRNLIRRNYLAISSTEVLIDTLSFADEEKSTIQLPTSIAFGASLAKTDKYELNVDYYFSKWGEAKFYGNSINDYLNPDNTTGTDAVSAENLSRFSIGGEYIPEAASIRSFFKRVKYRAGLHYEKSYLKIGDKQINEFGISFGVGLPVNRSRSTINLAVEAGRRGTTVNSLVRENYTKVSLYLNLHDRWFFQRKFD
ncbi:hypothetical protein ACUNWD_05370 [Sunxiuqinia sp. A32]|uniref:hypothetical protein n=1 Tax=Sunxiuqinia sp. A32 TaxID=3461496 RepID=UPI0040460ACC